MRPWKPKRRVVAAKERAYALVDARAGDVCEMCGRAAPKGQREHSHRSHAGHGGAPSTLRASNLLVSCGPFGCNWRLSAEADFARAGRANGWLIGRQQNPEAVPVLIADKWLLLCDDGTVKECPDSAPTLPGLATTDESGDDHAAGYCLP